MIDANTPSHRRTTGTRRFALRFRLRTLLLFVTALCVAMCWWLSGAFRQREAVRHFYAITAQRKATSRNDYTTMGYRYQGEDKYYKPIIPKHLRWLSNLIGEECFGEVTGVQLIESPATDGDLAYLRVFPDIERLNLSGTLITDAGLDALSYCSRLNHLALNDTAITDQGLRRLTQFQELESVSLSQTKITDDGLVYLARLPRLKSLWLRGTSISDEAYQRLQKALPECQIQADVPSYWQKVNPAFGKTGLPER